MPKHVYGSIHPVKNINPNLAWALPWEFSGNIADKALLPKKAQEPDLPNESTCLFTDDNSKVFIYNIADDTWYNSADSTDKV